MKDKSTETTIFILLDRLSLHQRIRNRLQKRIEKTRSMQTEERLFAHKEMISLLEDIIFRMGAY